MEGEADRREDGDSPEGQSDSLDGYRDEIKEKYPDSGDTDQGKTQQESGEVVEHKDGISDAKLDGGSETERGHEFVDSSIAAGVKSELHAELRSDTADEDGDGIADHSELSAEPEKGESDLEQFRDDVREKYPSERQEGAPRESDRSSENKEEGADGLNTQAGKTGNGPEKREPDGGATFEKTEERVSQVNNSVDKSESEGDEVEASTIAAARQPNDPSAVGVNFEHASSLQHGVESEPHRAPDRGESVNQQEPLVRREETRVQPLESDSHIQAGQTEWARASDNESNGRTPSLNVSSGRSSSGEGPGAVDANQRQLSTNGRVEGEPRPDLQGTRPRENFEDKQIIVSVVRRNTARDGAYHFNLLNSKVEKIFGVAFEEGKKYEFNVRIESVGEFHAHHVQRKNIAFVIEVPHRFTDRVKEGEAHKLTIDSVVEQPKLRAVSARDGVSLRISWTDVEAFGIDRRTKREHGRTATEFQLQNLSKPENPKRYFSSHEAKSSYQFLVGNRGAREGDVFRLVEARKYGIADFVKDFDVHGSPETRNLKLNMQRGRLSLEVDRQTIQFQQWHLTAFGNKVLLSATPKGWEREIRFRFDGENIESKFDRYSQLNWIKGTRYGIEISYSPDSRREIRYRRSLSEFDGSMIVDNVTLVSRPEYDGGPFPFTVAPAAQEYVRFRLGATEKYRGYMFEKGRVSEELQRHLVSSTGQWDEIATHPTRYGPDSLQRSKASKELYYFEFKWEQSKSIEGTRADAIAQAIRDFHNRPVHQGEPVTGAYIGMLDWDGDGIGKFYLEKVWPKP